MVLKAKHEDKWYVVGSLNQAGDRGFSISGVPDYTHDTRFIDNITTLNLERIQLNVPVGGSTSYLFAGSGGLRSFPDYTSPVTGEVTQTLTNLSRSIDASFMFAQCKGLQHIGDVDLSNATNMAQIFYGCSELLTVESINATRTKRIQSAFSGCYKLESLKMYNLKNVITNMDFDDCSNLKTLILQDLGASVGAPYGNSTLYVNNTALDADGMNELSRSLGNVNSENTAWTLQYNRLVNFDTTIASDKGWILNPV